ncbi:MAG: hypothetical protein ACOYB0_08355 [Polynucleobacter sp.]
MIAMRYGPAAGMLAGGCLGYLIPGGELGPIASILGTGAAAYLGAAWGTLPVIRAIDETPLPDPRWIDAMMNWITTTRAAVTLHSLDIQSVKARLQALERAARTAKN